MPLGSPFGNRQTLGRGGNLGNGMSLINGQMVRVPPPPEYTPEAAFPRAIEQQAGDYDRIMRGYEGELARGNPEYGGLMQRYQQLLQGMQGGPAQHTYGETGQFNEAFGSARDLARTGGISDTEEASMRARGVSPIRAAYQNAARNMERQARLGGGRSANFNAAAARMAREQGESMAGALTNVNAGIAEQRQRGRIAGTGNMTTMGEGSSGRMNQVGMFNANARNEHGQTMAQILASMGQLSSGEAGRRGEALRGMTSLYGTTPALVSTFGNQVQNAQQMAAQNPRPLRRTGAGVGGISLGGYSSGSRMGAY